MILSTVVVILALTWPVSIFAQGLGDKPTMAPQSDCGDHTLKASVASLLPDPDANGNHRASWEHGVSDAMQNMALLHLRKGLALHKQLRFVDAAASYERGLVYWDHPKLHYYRGLALSKTAEYLAAYESLSRALAGHPQALRARERAFAHHTARQLLSDELAIIAVQCTGEGSEVSIDGESWFVGPGSERKVVKPGAYSLNVDKPNYVSASQIVHARRGELLVLEPQMVHIRDAVRVHRRWPRLLPWQVVTAGLLGTASGGAFLLVSTDQNDKGRRFLRIDCPDINMGNACTRPRGRDFLKQARTYRQLGIALLAIGGGVLLAGAGMQYWNRGRIEKREDTGTFRVRLRPFVDSSGAGATMRIRF